MNPKTTSLAAGAFLLSFFLSPSGYSQGSVTPPGTPGPTMKTLDQVEARIPIDATHTPGDADANAVLRNPGSYYLTGNFDVTNGAGILVTAPDVTLDLNGYEIRPASGNTSAIGVKIVVGGNRCTVKNGSVSGLTYGIIAAADDSFTQAEAASVTHVRVSGCTFGISLGAK